MDCVSKRRLKPKVGMLVWFVEGCRKNGLFKIVEVDKGHLTLSLSPWEEEAMQGEKGQKD